VSSYWLFVSWHYVATIVQAESITSIRKNKRTTTMFRKKIVFFLAFAFVAFVFLAP
jgi:hypothetical protein